ncbi:hypothetical protein CRUP_005114 [Coryphaenoides rupestris]|nr:hypothetical protein CRUP_005114 [Coryphaenoides rupestris]
MALALGDSHRRFLQSLMVQRIMDEGEAKKLHCHCCSVHKEHYAADRLEEFIGVINSRLEPMFMRIRVGASEDDGTQYYALVNPTPPLSTPSPSPPPPLVTGKLAG